MHIKSRGKITSALHVIQKEVFLETNRTERIKALIREYLSERLTQDHSIKGKNRRTQIEEELHRFSGR